MKKIKFKYYLALVISIVVMGVLYNTFFVSNINHDDEVFAAVNKFSNINSSDVEIIFNEKINDNREDFNSLSFTLFSKENVMITKSPPLKVTADTALNVMKVNSKNYTFPKPIEKSAISYRWFDGNDQWSMTILKTSVGFYSYWEMLRKI